MARMTMRDAIKEAMREEMLRDPRVFLMGEDIGLFGGVFKVTKGLWEEFGAKRIIEMPISETAIAGAGIGAAMMGMRPIVEIMFADFLTCAMDQIVNNAAKMRYGHGGEAEVPMVIRSTFGAGTRSGMQHCQSVESWFLNVPGLKIVMPSNASDAKGLLKSAVRDPNPVLFLEHKMLYSVWGEVPDGEALVPIGKARVARAGRDLTIVTLGSMVPKVLRVAEQLAGRGVEVEVIDLRSVYPMDTETIVESAAKTARLMIVHEAPVTGGIGAEVAAIAAKECFGYLDAPIERVGAPYIPVPFSPTMEDYYIPGEDRILSTASALVGV
ncbi:MAG TPA: alpha-ketoacid dehydrogenase subunit beta [Chloroflexota bacterium]|nr:alpha-ketoacid dehydrogenase subunit beta [Chloroflexota bacterium]